MTTMDVIAFAIVGLLIAFGLVGLGIVIARPSRFDRDGRPRL